MNGLAKRCVGEWIPQTCWFILGTCQLHGLKFLGVVIVEFSVRFWLKSILNTCIKPTVSTNVLPFTLT